MKSIKKDALLSAANRFDDQAYSVGNVIIQHEAAEHKPDMRRPIHSLSEFINEERKPGYPNIVSGLLDHFETILSCMIKGLGNQGLERVRSELTAISQGCKEIRAAYS